MKYLIYVTKAKPYLGNKDTFGKYHLEDEYHFVDKYLALNGKIVAEFEGECEEFDFDTMSRDIFSYWYTNGHEVDYDKMGLTYDELWNYIGDKGGYAIHIKNLKVFDKPLELSETLAKQRCEICLYKYCKYYINGVCRLCQLSKAPQNMCYVWYKGELYCLISIQPQWSCKILNREKTIEVRKKVLKGCL